MKSIEKNLKQSIFLYNHGVIEDQTLKLEKYFESFNVKF